MHRSEQMVDAMREQIRGMAADTRARMAEKRQRVDAPTPKVVAMKRAMGKKR